MVNVQLELERLKRFYLLWYGKFAVFKMMILRKIPYCFRTLPIFIPPGFLHNMQQIISFFNLYGLTAEPDVPILL